MNGQFSSCERVFFELFIQAIFNLFYISSLKYQAAQTDGQ